MEKLLMLGTSLASEEIVKYAKSQGVYTIVTDYLEPEKSTAKLISDEYWMISTGELDVLEKKCREENITSVMCGCSEFNLEMTMELCKRLGLRSYCTPEAWHYSKDKSDFKKICKKAGASVATDYYISDGFAEDELNLIVFPVVVKPVDLIGNRGVSFFYNKEQLIESYEYVKRLSKNPKIIVERMLHGREWYSYYAIAQGEIRQIALNAMEKQPGELKNLYSFTTTVTDNIEKFNREINPAIKKILKAVGCREGIAWVQVMLDADDKFYIIEMGYRLPGDMPFIVYPDIFGFDSIKWLTDYARGINNTIDMLPDEQEHAYKSCGCGYTLWSNKAGKITSINGINEITKILGVSYYPIYRVGEEFTKHIQLGVVGVYADNCDELCEKIAQVNNTISVLNEEGEDVIIRYTNFEYLKENYRRGMERR